MAKAGDNMRALAWILGFVSLSALLIWLAMSSRIKDQREMGEVRQWLARLPDDSPTTRETKGFSFDDWIADGKAIKSIEGKLLHLLGSPNATRFEQQHAVIALGFLGGRASVSTLMSILQNGDSWQTEAAAALGIIGDAKAVDALCAATKNRNHNVRANACLALGRIGGIQAEACLREALADEDSWVRDSAFFALQRFREKK